MNVGAAILASAVGLIGTYALRDLLHVRATK
ncbi:hypothetical protein LCGC14_1692540, partial [marine sediment metagenome]